jgi:hypothetical protein
MSDESPPGDSSYRENNLFANRFPNLFNVRPDPESVEARLDMISQQLTRVLEVNANLLNTVKRQEVTIDVLQANHSSSNNNGMNSETSLENKTIQIQKLNDKNYRTWAKEIEIIFREMDFWNLLLGQPKYKDNPNERPYSEKEKERAYRILYQSCDDNHKGIIVNIQDPKIAWENIMKIFKPNNSLSKLLTMKKFFEMRKEENEAMDTFYVVIINIT